MDGLPIARLCARGYACTTEKRIWEECLVEVLTNLITDRVQWCEQGSLVDAFIPLPTRPHRVHAPTAPFPLSLYQEEWRRGGWLGQRGCGDGGRESVSPRQLGPNDSIPRPPLHSAADTARVPRSIDTLRVVSERALVSWMTCLHGVWKRGCLVETHMAHPFSCAHPQGSEGEGCGVVRCVTTASPWGNTRPHHTC